MQNIKKTSLNTKATKKKEIYIYEEFFFCDECSTIMDGFDGWFRVWDLHGNS